MMMMEVGEVIKFAELAWVVFEYGWTRELNASRQYHEFFRDVQQLAESLESLTDVIDMARRSFANRHLSPPPVTFGWDRDTLIEIVGDFDATLRECHTLIRTNKSYAATTGPVRNLQWNAMVMPSVERLRSRLLMHQSKITLVLQPFKIDLHLRLHQDLAERITEVHNDVRSTQADVRSILRDMQALKRHFDPSSLQDADQAQPEPVAPTLAIPAAIQEQLEEMFVLHPDRGMNEGWSPSLSAMADAFVRNLDIASPLDEVNGVLLEEGEDTRKQYIALLTCQFLMTKMLASADLVQAAEMSHWPRFVRSLQQQLEKVWMRFDQSEIADAFSDGLNSFLVSPIWEEDAPAPYIESATVETAIEHLLELPLASDSPGRWRKIKLSRYCDGTDRHFLLIITAGDTGKPAAETRRVDFDLDSTSLVPRYASPTGQEPLEIILKPRNEEFRLVFCSRIDLYGFQQALTGYQVMDNYMPYRVQTIFVVGSSGQEIKEYASLQLWLPSRLSGDRTGADPDIADLDDGDDDFLASPRTQTFETQGWDLPSSPERRSSSWLATTLDRRRSSTSTGNATPTHVRDSWNTTNGYTSEQLPTSPSLSSRSLSIFRRASNGPANLSRSPQHDQQTQRLSRGSLSSSSSSSTGTVRHDVQRRRSSFSGQSINSTLTSASTATARKVSVSGGGNISSEGTLHCKPSEPMLVLFTRDVKTGSHGIVAVSLDQRVTANYHACECTRMPNCRLTVIEKTGNDGRSVGALPVLRLGGVQGNRPWWDILSLAESMKSRRSMNEASSSGDRRHRVWQRVIRVTMCFQTAAERSEFAGHPCTCTPRFEWQLMKCLLEGHRGRLGIIRENYRRDMVRWYDGRYRQRVNMVNKPHAIGAGHG